MCAIIGVVRVITCRPQQTDYLSVSGWGSRMLEKQVKQNERIPLCVDVHVQNTHLLILYWYIFIIGALWLWKSTRATTHTWCRCTSSAACQHTEHLARISTGASERGRNEPWVLVEGLDFRHNDVWDFIKDAAKNIDHPVSSSSRPLGGDASLQEVRGSSQWLKQSLVPRLSASNTSNLGDEMGSGWLTVARRHPRVPPLTERTKQEISHGAKLHKQRAQEQHSVRRASSQMRYSGGRQPQKFAVNNMGARIRPAVHHDPGLLVV